MRRIYQNFLFIAIFFFSVPSAFAQLVADTTQPVSVDPLLMGIFDAKQPKEYTIAGINVVGNRGFDPNLIISISGLFCWR